MAADNVTSMEQQVDQARAGLAEATSIYQDNLGALIASGQALVNSCQTMHGAALAFAQSRAKEALATGQRLAECGSPQNALEIQLEFAREALQAYADHFARVSTLTGDALKSCAQPLQRRAPALSERTRDRAA
jgi:hypothetical protein